MTGGTWGGQGRPQHDTRVQVLIIAQKGFENMTEDLLKHRKFIKMIVHA